MAWDAIAEAVASITAVGALGTAAFGLVDAFKCWNGGVSNVGFKAVKTSLAPFAGALQQATPLWEDTLRANWINGVAKEDQKTAAKTLIRLGLNTSGAVGMAKAANIDAADLTAAIGRVEQGLPLSPQDAQLFGRLNAVIDAAMDAGYEKGDQQYRNASKCWAAFASVILALAAGLLLSINGGIEMAGLGKTLTGPALLGWSVLVGVIAVPVAPIAKDLASSLQSAASAVNSLKP